MNIMVVGKPDSGKSVLAERLAEELGSGAPKIYLATMIPFGEAGAARVEKHRKMRLGKGFLTVECPTGVDLIPARLDEQNMREATCLLECMSNLIGNEMHDKGNAGKSLDDLTALICSEILALGREVKNLILVTNEFSEDPAYDEDTKKYVELAGLVNRELCRYIDRIYRLEGGEWKLEENI